MAMHLLAIFRFHIDEAIVKFKMSLIPYEVNTDWIEPTLMQIKECLLSEDMPPHHAGCEHGQFLKAVGDLNDS